MSTLLDIFSLILSADVGSVGMDAAGGGGSSTIPLIQTCANTGALCPAASFTALGAAYATQGYYAQADLLFYLTHGSMHALAPLLYLIAAAGGLTALALGAPPKMYLWFFIGPGIYHWLLETRLPAHGVQWTVAGIAQDQREVWRLAEVGLQNMPIIDRLKTDDRLDYEGTQVAPNSCRPALDPVQVSYFFLYYDELVSSVVQNVVKWTGVFRQRVGAESSSTSTSINPLNVSSSSGLTTTDTGGAAGSDRWYLLANQKWAMLDTITSARVSNADVRDLLSTFLSSECGDALMNTVDKRNYAAANNSKSGRLPCSLMLQSSEGNESDNSLCGEISSGSSTIKASNYERLYREMQKDTLPIPASARRLMNDQSTGSFSSFINGESTSPSTSVANYLSSQNTISCPSLFYLVVEAFRWEAGHVYHQLVSRAPASMGRSEFLFNLFYGWNIRNSTGTGSQLLESDDIRQWTTNLILVHLLKNELAMTKKVADPRLNNEKQLQTYSDNTIGQTGAKTKFSEIYSWARMIPYIQGIFLYILAMGYPFACVLIVMPGWHKSLFTWMSFWLWVKMWDIGFALVLVMERSIWSTIGNNSTIGNLSPLINTMKNWGSLTVFCPGGDSTSGTLMNSCQSIMAGGMCAVPSITEGLTSVKDSIEWWQAAAIFDRALLIGSAIDLDVSNGYYIYIMSALYFAVPAVTGQLVLGAKAGMASFVGNITDGAKGDASGAAKGGFTGDLRNKGAAVSEAVRQEAQLKAFRGGKFAEKALDISNRGMDAGLEQQMAGARERGIGALAGMNALRQSNAKAGLAATTGLLGLSSTASGLAFLGAAGIVDGFGNGTTPANLAKLEAIGAAAKAASTPGPNFGKLGLVEQAVGQLGTQNRNTGGRAGLTDGTAAQLPNGSGVAGPAPFPSGGFAGTGVIASGGPVGTGGMGGFAGSGPAVPMGTPAGAGGRSLATPTHLIGAGAAMGMASAALRKIGLSGLEAQSFAQGVQNFGNYGIDKMFNNQAAGYQMAQSDQSIQAFKHGTESSQLGEYKGRFGAQAEFQAQNQSWYARRDLSNDTSGYMASLGVDSSYLAPGSKPADMMGAAMSGNLGANAYSMGQYASDGGGFSQRASSYSNGLSGMYGSGSMNALYATSSTPGEEFAYAWNNAGSSSAQVFQAVGNLAGSVGTVSGTSAVTQPVSPPPKDEKLGV